MDVGETTPFYKFENISLKQTNIDAAFTMPFYRIIPFDLTENPETDKKIQNFLIKKYSQFFYHNSYRNLMSLVDHRKFNASSVDKLIEEPNSEEFFKFLVSLNVKFLEEFDLRFQLNNAEQKALIKKEMEENLLFLCSCYKFCLVNYHQDNRDLVPKNDLEAISLNLAFSQFRCLVAYDATLNNEPIKDFLRFAKFLLTFSEQERKAKEKASKERQPSKNRNQNEEFESEADSTSSQDYDEKISTNLPTQQSSENLEKEAESNEKEPNLKMIKDMPYTLELVYFSTADMVLTSSFKQVYFLSATYPVPSLLNVKNSLSNIKFIEFDSQEKKLDKLYLISSNLDWFSNKNKLWREAWEKFSKFFQLNFFNKENINEQKYCLLLTPTNRDAEQFYAGCCNNSRIITLIRASEEKINFSEQQQQVSTPFRKTPEVLNPIIRVASILSTISTGLNMPEHILIFAAANNYKPTSTIWRYGEIEAKDARNYETTMSLIQAIGRNARRNLFEKETNALAERVVLISKANSFSNIVTSLTNYSNKLYDQVEIIDIGHIEPKFSKFFKSKILLNNFNSSLDYFDKDFLDKISPISKFSNSVEIRFNLIQEILICVKNKSDSPSEIVRKYDFFLNNYTQLTILLYLTNILYNLIEIYYSTENSLQKTSIFNQSLENNLKFSEA